MPLHPLRRRQIVTQKFTQKIVLLPFPAKKNSYYFHFKFHDLWISIFNLPNANYLCAFVTESCFQKPQYPSEAPVFSLFIFTVNRTYSVLRCHSCYRCFFLYWQTSYAFTRFLLCICFSLDVFIYKIDKGFILRCYVLTGLLWQDLMKRDSLEDVGVYERIILKCNFQKWDA